ncbi:RusA family crossover junction endodeoxyribonuclease [Nitrobacter vulgaris]|uniref:RusA family crossover junction endodeoxyribonuclease n=1 Tax=Nitrobacter vulgaris TaxID=29421 RepID=UPI0035B52799
MAGRVSSSIWRATHLSARSSAKKPDLDNIAKTLSDAFDGAVFRDDALITRAVLEKTYEPQPPVLFTVRAAR